MVEPNLEAGPFLLVLKLSTVSIDIPRMCNLDASPVGAVVSHATILGAINEPAEGHQHHAIAFFFYFKSLVSTETIGLLF
jgi:hypothetical protein